MQLVMLAGITRFMQLACAENAFQIGWRFATAGAHHQVRL